MNFKKFISVAALSILALFITACSKNPESSFKNNLDLGNYQGMHITWIKDDADTKGTGFYIINDVNIDTSKPNNTDFVFEKFVGNYGNLKIFWVKDNSEANSKGFYLFRNNDNQLVSSLTMGERFSSGKSNSTKNVGVVFTSAINNPSLQIKLDDKPYEETVKISDLSSAELMQLSQRLLDVAQQKQLDNNTTVKPKF